MSCRRGCYGCGCSMTSLPAGCLLSFSLSTSSVHSSSPHHPHLLPPSCSIARHFPGCLCVAAGLECSMILTQAADVDRKLSLMPCLFLLKVTSDNYAPVSSSVNGSGFRPFDMVIPFSFRKGEITGESRTACHTNVIPTVSVGLMFRSQTSFE